jgi:hypothetical protein
MQRLRGPCERERESFSTWYRSLSLGPSKQKILAASKYRGKSPCVASLSGRFAQRGRSIGHAALLRKDVDRRCRRLARALFEPGEDSHGFAPSVHGEMTASGARRPARDPVADQPAPGWLGRGE